MDPLSSHQGPWLTLVATLLGISLAGCGGGHEASSITPDSPAAPSPVIVPTTPTTPTVPTVPTVPSLPDQSSRINTAMATGNASTLLAEDREALLQRALGWSSSSQTAQQAAVRAILGVDGRSGEAAQNSTVTWTGGESIDINVQRMQLATPLLVSNTGKNLATVGLSSKGRTLAYGTNILAKFNKGQQLQHLPLFRRALTWLLTGNARGTLPSTIRYNVNGYAAQTVQTYVQQQLQITGTAVSCNVFDPANTCWQDIDLLVIGGGSDDPTVVQKQLALYMAAGKAVLILPGYWNDSERLRPVLNALGMSPGGYPGNYFSSSNELSIGADRTTAQTITAVDQWQSLVSAIKALANPALPQQDFAADRSLITGIDRLHDQMRLTAESGSGPFRSEASTVLRALVLWADLWRPQINYGKTLNWKGDSQAFLRAYASDSFLDFGRTVVAVNPGGAGDYMPKAALNVTPSSSFETLNVTLPQGSGVVSLGRMALPGQLVTLVPASTITATMRLQTSHLRTAGTPLADAGYLRPRRPHSFSLPAKAGVATTLNTPFGGPLYLRYDGATAGQVIALQIRGVSKYAHFDYSQPMSAADESAALAALQTNTLGWNTIKFKGGEIQQTIPLAQKAMGSHTPAAYLERIRRVIFESNHIANGYNNQPLTPTAASACSRLGWDCTGNLHQPPSVQHFVGWMATCGWLCSGNPTDAYTGVDVGWGWAHELGHNTVQRVLSMTFVSSETGLRIGCGVECDNNILAGLTMMRKYALYGEDTNGGNFDSAGLYQQMLASRATGLAGEALRRDLEKRLWGGGGGDNPNAKQAVHIQLAYLYSRLALQQARPDLGSTLEFIRLLNIGNRVFNQISAADWTRRSAELGLSGFASKDAVTTPDLVYALSSKIVQQDLAAVFEAYGLPVSSTSRQSVAALGLPMAGVQFYAQAKGRANHLDEGRWLNVPANGTLAAYPF